MNAALVGRNRRSALAAFAIVLGMVALGFASVPLYRIFCQVTGFNGTTQRVEAGAATVQPTSRMITVRFDSNVSPNLPWEFRPEQVTERVAIGQRKMAFYEAHNYSSSPVTGSAVFNVTPLEAGVYFTKIQCFCFTEQTLQPGQSVRMPVTYYVDPDIMNDPDIGDVEEITLSYTFYPVDDGDSRG